MMFAKLFAASLVLSLFVGLASSAEPDAKNDRMQMVLRRYPEADADKDGKLSKEEARAFLAKMKSAKSAAGRQRIACGQKTVRRRIL